jgi:hypothetical protein
MPVSILRVVDLPAPLGPTNATRSPFSIVNERPSTATASRVEAEKSWRTAAPSPAARARTLKTLERFSTSMDPDTIGL